MDTSHITVVSYLLPRSSLRKGRKILKFILAERIKSSPTALDSAYNHSLVWFVFVLQIVMKGAVDPFSDFSDSGRRNCCAQQTDVHGIGCGSTAYYLST